MRLPRFWPFRKPAAPDEGRLAMGNFNLSAQLPNQRQIQFSAYVYSDDTPESVDSRLDHIQERIERQRARCEIPELEAAREQKIKALEQARDVLSDLEGRQQAGDKLSSQDQMTIKNLRVNLAKANEDIEKGKQAIAEAKRRAGIG
jgi:hypothetical protein